MATQAPPNAERWRARQREFYELRAAAVDVLEDASATEAELEPIARQLAGLLQRFGDDSELWDELRAGREALHELTHGQRAALQGALDINWAPFLVEAGYEPPPPADAYAHQFRRDIALALNDPAAVDLAGLRTRVKSLAKLLDPSAARPRIGSVTWLKAGLRRALPALKRGALVHGVGAVASLGAGALGNLIAPGAGFVAAALVKGGVTTALDRAVPKLPDPDDAEHARSFEEAKERLRELLRPERIGQLRSKVDFTREAIALVADHGQMSAEELLTLRLAREDQEWVEDATATVFLVWSLGAGEQMPESVLRELAGLADRLSRIAMRMAEVDELDRVVLDLEQLVQAHSTVLGYLAHGSRGDPRLHRRAQ